MIATRAGFSTPTDQCICVTPGNWRLLLLLPAQRAQVAEDAAPEAKESAEVSFSFHGLRFVSSEARKKAVSSTTGVLFSDLLRAMQSCMMALLHASNSGVMIQI